MVNAFGLDGDQYKVGITQDITQGWQELSNLIVNNTWISIREIYLVSTRHSGAGILALSFSTNGDLDDYSWSMNLTGVGSVSDGNTLYPDCKFLLTYGTDHILRLYYKSRDYNTAYFTRLSKYGTMIMKTPSDISFTTTDPKTTYAGRYLEAEYNAPSIIVSSSQPSAKTTSALLWIQP